MKTKLIGLLVAAIALGATAQDKALLETLVKKGTLTQQEAAQIAKESVAVTPGAKDTKSIKIYGGVAAQYGWSQADDRTAGVMHPQSSGFELRYIKLGVAAEVGAGWSVDICTDFGTEGKDRNYLDKVVLSKKFAYDHLVGQLDIGLRKVNFGQEQNMCDFGQLAIDRSIATYFFTRPDYLDTDADTGVRKNMGSRNVGIFWDGQVAQVEGLYYGVAVVGGNTMEDGWAFGNYNDGDNNLSFYVNGGYKNVATIKDHAIAYDFGVNFAYASGGYSWKDASPDGYANRAMWGVNPYASVKWQGLTVLGEFFMQGIEDASVYGYSHPVGINATVAYKFEVGAYGALEPVLRYSWLEGNGVGYSRGDLYSVFDNAKQIYVGGNWYVVPSVKVSLGYTFEQLTNDPASMAPRCTNNNGVKAQLQIIF